MALRTAIVKITRPGRDIGKEFLITELPAEQAEDWFLRAMAMLSRAGADVPPDMFQYGAAAFATIGVGAALSGISKTPWSEARPLLEEMFSCVSYISPSGGSITIPSMVASQIEEVSTRLQLREEVLSLHLGFSLAAKLSELRATAAMLLASNMPNMSTSPEQSE